MLSSEIWGNVLSSELWGVSSIKSWLIAKILDALKVDGVFAILPFQPTIGVGVGPRVGSIRITCDVVVDESKGHSEWIGNPADIVETGPLAIFRKIQEEAIHGAIYESNLVNGSKDGIGHSI